MDEYVHGEKKYAEKDTILAPDARGCAVSRDMYGKDACDSDVGLLPRLDGFDSKVLNEPSFPGSSLELLGLRLADITNIDLIIMAILIILVIGVYMKASDTRDSREAEHAARLAEEHARDVQERLVSANLKAMADEITAKLPAVGAETP